MAVDPAILGRTYPPDDVYEVGREVLRAFAEATAAGRPVHPAHVDPRAARELGHPDVVAPPTFAVVVAQRSEARLVRDPAAGIDLSRVVHGEQRFTHHRPIVAGDRLVAALHVDGVRSMGGNDLVTMRSEITAEDGEPVCTATSMLVVRGAA
ncbi:MaoC family dehydratase N-terminal domain-containing protein [Quadrisphaera sp. DSM 44207]|uniref:FAS1-like dehydratase domain-containing protein n=1 Tax=Quadrisphaera sp. DSM 44207 TaxID=1881057 RepID=UPI00088DEE14|nr:MaoC family dehydratase N-terminal domain-containing protein [Quadrisphaera sp. DSM 44207]SDQ14942.1 Acyl dehydratase [Quadrisphaera sp. DSM 44207]